MDVIGTGPVPRRLVASGCTIQDVGHFLMVVAGMLVGVMLAVALILLFGEDY